MSNTKDNTMSSHVAPIPGGYVIKPRRILNSEIAKAPPHVREVSDFLVMKANHKPAKIDGRVIKRGQLLITYDAIRDGLSWKVGYRVERYSKWDCEKAMKVLTKAGMITKVKTTRGLFITICNYDYYQDPANYESHPESHARATRKPQPTDTINKNVKNKKNVRRKEEDNTTENSFTLPLDIDSKAWAAFEAMRSEIKKPLTDRARGMVITELHRLQTQGEDTAEVLLQSARCNYPDVYGVTNRKKPRGNGIPMVTPKTSGNWALLRKIEEEHQHKLGGETNEPE